MNAHRRTAAAAMMITLVVRSLAAERLPVRTLTTADGLPSDQLACVFSDARGFVWFCTAEGLVRFDGHSAVSFGRNEGLDPPGVRSYLSARDGRDWIGTDGGLVEFRPGARDKATQFRLVTRDDGRPTGAINALGQSRDGAVWCASGRGLLRLTDTADADHLQEIDIGLPRESENDQIVRVLLEDERGTLWVGAGSGLYARSSQGRTVRFTTSNGLPVNEVRALAIDASQRLWAGTRQGLALIDRDAMDRGHAQIVRRVYATRDGLPATNVHALYVDGGTLWVGTVGGVAETTVAQDGRLNAARTLTGFYAWAIASDARGDIWIATEAGARKLTRHGFTTYLKSDGLPSSRVSSIFEDRAGNVCATTLVRRLQISCFDGSRFHRVPVPAALSIPDPGWGWSQLTLQDRKGRWWIPTGEGLLEFAAGPASSLASAPPLAVYDVRAGLRSNNIFRLFEDSGGGIWIATFDESGNGLARVDPQSAKLRVFGQRDGLPNDLPIVQAFGEDRAGGVWIGLEYGLLIRYRDGRFDTIPIHGSGGVGPSSSSASEHLRSIVTDRRGQVWIASILSGVGRVEDPTAVSPMIRWYGTSDGLSSDTAWMLVEDESGELFVGTGRGVDRFNTATGAIVHYTADDGLPRGEIWGALRDRSGRIWFATTGGAARLDVAEARPRLSPVTVVTAIRVGGIPLPMPADGATTIDAVTVEPGDRRIEIEFVSPGAREADGLRHQYRLEGVDREWTPTDARTVAFANAAPGRYWFVVRATLAGGIVSEPARVEFTVLAPLWQRWWFITLAATALAMAVFTAHRTRVRRLLEVERVRSRIAADLHDGVGANLSRIAILSEVVRRQAEPVLPGAMATLATIAGNAREVIDDMSDAVWFIDPRLDTLQQIVVRTRAIASELFDDHAIAWTLEAPEAADRIALASDQRRHLHLIIKESLTNIVRHAQASQVTIRIVVVDRRLRMEITDNGRGLGAAPKSCAGGGHGHLNMRERAAAIGGWVAFASGAKGRGTCVTLDVPARFTA